MIEIIDMRDLSFEEVYMRLSKHSKIRITSDFDEENTPRHELSFVDPRGNLCTIIGDRLKEVTTMALTRVELLGQREQQ